MASSIPPKVGEPDGTIHLWDVDTGDGVIGFDQATHSLAVYSAPSTIKVLDSRTGKLRWSSTTSWMWWQSTDRRMTMVAPGLALVSDPMNEGVGAVRLSDGTIAWHVASYTVALGDGEAYAPIDSGVLAVDASDGATRWTRTDIGCGNPSIVAVAGGVVTLCSGTVRLLSASDGTTKWSMNLPATCAGDALAGSDVRIVFASTCAKAGDIEEWDIATNSRLWQHGATLPVSNEPGDDPTYDLEFHDGIALVSDGTGTQGLTSSGSPIPGLPAHISVMFARPDGSGAYVYGTATDGTSVLESVDAATGRIAWTANAGSGSLVYSNAVFYGTGDGYPPLDDKLLTTINANTGATDSRLVSPIGGTVAAVDDGAVIMNYLVDRRTTARYRLAAVRIVGPPTGYLGGAPAAAWPNPCTLLTAAEMTGIEHGDAYVSKPLQNHPFDLALGHPVQCELLPDKAGRPVVTISTLWTAATSAQAGELLDTFAAGDSTTISHLGDAAIEYNTTSEAAAATSHTIVIRVGATDVSVKVVGSTAAAKAAAKIVVAALRPTGT